MNVEDDALTPMQDEYSILNSKHFIGIHGYMIVYSVGSRPSFDMVRNIREKILNHLVSTRAIVHLILPAKSRC
jgi:Ras family